MYILYTHTFLLQSADEAAAYNPKKFREAATKEEQCKVPLDVHGDWRTEKRKKEYHEHCLNSKSNNLIFCPQKIIKRKKDKMVQWKNDHLNDYIKSLGEKSKKSKPKEKSEEKEKQERIQEEK